MPRRDDMKRMIAVHNHIERMKGEEMAEKLVEELDNASRREMGLVPYANLSDEERGFVRQFWMRAITRISQAIADGELMLTKVPPKLPGEQRRYPYYSYQDDMGHGDFHAVEYWGKKKPDGMAILIALRKEEMEKER